MKGQVAIIDIISWAISLNGEHYSGYVHANLQRVEITQTITSSYANRLNKKDGGTTYHSGDTTCRFETSKSIISRGVELAKEHFPNVKCILFGSYASADPMEILWCADSELEEQLVAVWKEFRQLRERYEDPWFSHEKQMIEICDRWDDLVAALD